MKRVIVFTFIVLYTMCVYSQKATIDGITYNVTSAFEAEIKSAIMHEKPDIIIPEYVTIEGRKYLVTSVGYNAFMGYNNITSVTLPNSIKVIGDNAFNRCTELTYINIPKGVTSIGTLAFHKCKIKQIVIPEGVTKIGESAFAWCQNLTSVSIPNSVTSISEGAFYVCDNLKEITIPDSCVSIGKDAFAHCKSLTYVKIPNSVKSIGRHAFSALTNLKEVVVPDNVNDADDIFLGTENIVSIKGHNKKYPNWVIEYILANGNPHILTYRTAVKAKQEDSYHDYAYDNIMQLMIDWRKKKELETTTQWRSRVNEKAQKEQLITFQKQVREEYIETRKPKKIISSLVTFDSDYNIYSVKLNDKDTVFIDVPIEDVEYVKSKWSKVKVLEPKYGIVNDRLGILSAKFKLGKKIYNCTQIHDESTADLAINLPPLEFEIDGNNKSKSSAVQVAVDNSIDINIPTNSSDNSNTFAVIIGNEDYQQVSKVQYAKNDAKIFATYCEKTLGLPQKNIKLYQDATFGIMLSAVENIQNIAKAFKGDINIIFYYAGHGVPNESTNEAFLLPTDANGSNTAACYPINKLLKELKELNTNSVTVFMDACFSGAQRGEGMLASARGVAIKAKKVEPQGNMVVFSAASADETAYPYKEKGHGLFTYFLLKKLNETKGDVTLGELGDYISEKVAQESVVSNGKSQTPTVTVSQAVSDSWRNSKLR